MDASNTVTEFSLCQLPGKAYEKDLVATVVSSQPASLLLDRFGKTKPESGAFLDIILKETVFFAEGGGQPCDFGTMALQGGGARFEVVDVFPGPSGAVVHRVRAGAGAEGLVEGAAVSLAVDWARRYDHMQQHTAQHALSAVAEDTFGLKTTGWSLGPDRAYVDLDRPAAPDTLAAIESAVSEAIRRAAAVTVTFSDPGELDQVPGLRTRNLKAQGPIRLVRIEGLDVNTCCGTHLASLAEIQGVKVVASEPLRGGSRVSFVAGGRVFSLLGTLLLREQQTTRLLSCGGDEHVARIEELKAGAARDAKVRKALLKEIADALGRALAGAASAAAQSGDAVGGLLQVHHREDADAEAGLLNDAAGAALGAKGDLTVLLTMGTEKDGGVFLLRGPPDTVKTLSPLVAAGLESKGGGRPGFFQGKCAPGRVLGRAALDALHQVLRAALDGGPKA